MPAKPAKKADTIDAGPLLKCLRAFRRGDFSVRLPDDLSGINGHIAEAFNDVVSFNEKMANEFARVKRTVGSEGKVSERASPGGLTGSWAASVKSVNSLIGDLVRPMSDVRNVLAAVGKGDLTQSMEYEIEGTQLKGAFVQTARTVDTTVD